MYYHIYITFIKLSLNILGYYIIIALYDFYAIILPHLYITVIRLLYYHLSIRILLGYYNIISLYSFYYVIIIYLTVIRLLYSHLSINFIKLFLHNQWKSSLYDVKSSQYITFIRLLCYALFIHFKHILHYYLFYYKSYSDMTLYICINFVGLYYGYITL